MRNFQEISKKLPGFAGDLVNFLTIIGGLSNEAKGLSILGESLLVTGVVSATGGSELDL